MSQKDGDNTNTWFEAIALTSNFFERDLQKSGIAEDEANGWQPLGSYTIPESDLKRNVWAIHDENYLYLKFRNLENAVCGVPEAIPMTKIRLILQAMQE